MIVCRVVAWLLLALAVAAVSFEAVNWLDSGEWRVFASGELWFMLDRESLNLAQAVIQRYVHPGLWDPVAITVLQWPAWAIFGAPGMALALICRRRSQAAPGSATASRSAEAADLKRRAE